MKKLPLILFALALARSLVIALIISPSYGPDGRGYLMFIDIMQNPAANPDDLWFIRGTTPVYPFFAYAVYLFGLGSGYTIVAAQILLAAIIAPAIYLALRGIDERGARLAGVLLAIDPQTGHLFQLVATEALYISLLALGMVALFWNVTRQKSILAALLLGLLLGAGSFVRPVGTLLIVPYAFFYVLMTRSIKRTSALVAAYVAVFLILSTFNLWRFDFFAPNNTSGIYLATRLLGVGGLYDRENGEASEQLYQLAAECDIELSDSSDESDLEITQDLRLCLYYDHEYSLEEISNLYQRVYGEATRAKPLAFLGTMVQQAGSFMWKTSDAYDLDGARRQVTDCSGPLTDDDWHNEQRMFCPKTPTPLSFLGEVAFLGMLGFSLLTRVLNFALAALIFFRSKVSIRWLLLFCLAMYSYHALVTAAAGTILSRYITVTNPYMLITLAFSGIVLYDWVKELRLHAPHHDTGQEDG
jgi:4-amino-4-deoxy-L-arabinose transferase-like glycosyltransferase